MTADSAHRSLPPAPGTVAPEPVREVLILRGVKCPLNWARAKVRLEDLPVGTVLALVVDDERAVRDIPRAAEAHGYSVLEVIAEHDGWRIEIER